MSTKSSPRKIAHQLDVTRKTMRLPYTLIACLNENRELLMVKRNRPPFVGLWNLIGGKIDVGETPTSAAIREIKEEANILAKASRLSFRGIAIWPDTSEASIYTGMFLFRLQSKMKEGESKQLGMLHEGVTAWISVDMLLHPSDYIPVPNFELLASYMLDMSAPPTIICHEKYKNTVRVLWTCPVADAIASLPNAGLPLAVADLIQSD
jgi:8-oxo-dGTP diphosphatase